MSSIDLRNAAAVLRELAEGATSGPWRVLPIGSRADVRGLPENTSFDHRGDAVATAGDSEFGAMPEADAAYIAALSPPVALALADWLDAEAEHDDRWQLAKAQITETTYVFEGSTLDQALAVASAILKARA